MASNGANIPLPLHNPWASSIEYPITSIIRRAFASYTLSLTISKAPLCQLTSHLL